MRTRTSYGDSVSSQVFHRNHHTDPWAFVTSFAGHNQANRCRDQDNGNLYVDKLTCVPLGDIVVPDGFGGEYRYVDWIPNGWSWYPFSHVPLVSQDADSKSYWYGSVDQRATRLAAVTNVATPVVSVPQFVGELKDIPHSIYKRGKQGLSWAHLDSLGIRFGILPMVSDVLKMMNLADYIDQRDRNISKLVSKNGLKRRVNMGTASGTATGSEPAYGAGATYEVKVTSKRWGTIRWLPASGLRVPEEGTAERTQFVRGLLTGTSKYKDKVGYLSDAWELLPWSWMADWFTNTGEFIQASANRTISFPTQIWIMETTTVHQTITTSSGTCFSYLVSKQRNPGVVTAQMIDPIISGDRAAILSGLFIRGPSPIPRGIR